MRDFSINGRVHRLLSRQRDGNHQRGNDVKVLQHAINDRAKSRPWLRTLRIDGIAGPSTISAARETAEALGLVLFKGGVTESTQKVIRDPDLRTRAQEKRSLRVRKRKQATIRVVTQNLPGRSIFGRLGIVRTRTFHHSAGPRDRSDADAMRLNAIYNRDHAAKGWGRIGYHGNITTKGTVIKFPDFSRCGAHVGLHNSNNEGWMLHGNYDHDKLSEGQKVAIRAIQSGKLAKYGIRGGVPARGHNDWSGHESNACPGRNQKQFIHNL